MYSRIIKTVIVTGWIMAAVPVFAQGVVPTGATPPAVPVAATATAQAPETPAPDPDSVLLGQIRKQLDVKKAKAEVLGVDLQIQDSKNKLDGGASTGHSTAIPDLIGLYGTGTAMTAEFIVGGTSVLTARRGEWVTGDWQIESILGNGVVLKKQGSKERRTVLFGRRSVAGALGMSGSTNGLPQGSPYPAPTPASLASPSVMPMAGTSQGLSHGNAE